MEKKEAEEYKIPQRRIEFSFANQFKALFIKSWRNQVLLNLRCTGIKTLVSVLGAKCSPNTF